jgi:hypothetical protein
MSYCLLLLHLENSPFVIILSLSFSTVQFMMTVYHLICQETNNSYTRLSEPCVIIILNNCKSFFRTHSIFSLGWQICRSWQWTY